MGKPHLFFRVGRPIYWYLKTLENCPESAEIFLLAEKVPALR